jgi:Domain of unknown function (DUF4190)
MPAQPADPRPPASDDAATVALLLSVVGLLGCLPVGAAGVAMGYVARARIRDSDGALGGERTAHAAIVVGWIAIGISVVALIVLLVLMAVTGRG